MNMTQGGKDETCGPSQTMAEADGLAEAIGLPESQLLRTGKMAT